MPEGKKKDYTGKVAKDEYSREFMYPGLLMAFQYAGDLKEAMLSQISESMTTCEEHARTKIVEGVISIKQLGLLHLGDKYTYLSLRSDVMCRRKQDILARHLEVETELWDFFD